MAMIYAAVDARSKYVVESRVVGIERRQKPGGNRSNYVSRQLDKKYLRHYSQWQQVPLYCFLRSFVRALTVVHGVCALSLAGCVCVCVSPNGCPVYTYRYNQCVLKSQYVYQTCIIDGGIHIVMAMVVDVVEGHATAFRQERDCSMFSHTAKQR